ncbi:Amidohydrolase [Symmachiella dynata]|uniref:Amidohydrolase n=1 Tax=Symmachiella dynata TaxID=2527995 RepID=A0A517ZSQ1_9PLAN|nr:amidohydrolase family protein [Symmachiella dynata]QDU45521.1 Amidohydrolase [Symmachiella dynata]
MPMSQPHPNDMHRGVTRRECLALGALAALGTSLGERVRGDETSESPVIWDNHCHLSGVEGKTPPERMANLLKFADRLGIARVVVYMGWPFQTDPTAEELRRQNDQVLAAIKGSEERALAYAYVSPNHVEMSLSEMRRCIENGPMVGIKLWVARKCDDASLDAIIELASELNAVVFQHTWIKTTGNLPGESTPDDLTTLAARHPEAQFICGHAGGNWEQGIRAVRPFPNVSLGTAGSDPTAGLVEMAVRELGAERVIYGSDAGGRSFASQLGKVYSADLTDAQRQLILSGNLKRLLTPILKTKGRAN